MDLQWEKFSQGMQLYLWCIIIVFFPLYLSKAYMYIFSTWICSFYLPCFTICLLSVQKQYILAEFVCLTIKKCFQGMQIYLWCFIIILLSAIFVDAYMYIFIIKMCPFYLLCFIICLLLVQWQFNLGDYLYHINVT